MRPLRAPVLLTSFAAFLVLSVFPGPARATFSIVAADTGTGAIGSAGASCVPYEVIRILRVADGKGLLVGQAHFDDDALELGRALLADGEEPAAVLSAVTNAAVFPGAPKMQYGIIDTLGRTASVTGPEAKAWAGDMAGRTGDVAFTVQGNLLTGPEVLDQMTAAVAGGCDLAERLVRALEAAGADGHGDARCTDAGISASSAYVVVQQDGWTTLHVSLPDLRPEDPVAALRAALDEWRLTHPCPPPTPGASPTEPDTDLESPAGCAHCSAPPSAPAALLFGLVAAVLLLRAADEREQRRQCGCVPGPVTFHRRFTHALVRHRARRQIRVRTGLWQDVPGDGDPLLLDTAQIRVDAGFHGIPRGRIEAEILQHTISGTIRQDEDADAEGGPGRSVTSGSQRSVR